MSPKRSIRIEIGCDPVIFTNNIIFTNHSLLIFYLFRTLHLVAYSTYLLLFHLFSFFQQSTDKTQVLLFPLKVLCCFYVLGCIVNVSKSFQHSTHSKSTFSSNFLLFFPNAFPNLFQILHCFMHHTPWQFRPSSSLSLFFFTHSLPVCI